ncbi:ester hydrolase C11orf54 homolog [Nylanderia fulva]|uniref:ester hydrolase C11orf54 homolog n=1 Tax=Nylanderia fulva TaxID=613905 RepID=UPI0010FBA469|nr:ester hydrolase C11orf54 homolog [Nylanderia fulva]
MEMGGPEYLYKCPMPDAKRLWKITELIDHFYAPKTPVFVIGAGRSHRTFNSEVATNFIYSTNRKVTNRSHFNFVNKQGKCESELITNSNCVTCAQHGSFFMCNGSGLGYVFKIYAKGRQTDMNFPSVIQLALETRCEPNYFIGLGGTFVINNGIVRNEIRRPNFTSNVPSKICDSFTPLVAVGTILSRPKHITKHQTFSMDKEIHLEGNITVQNFNTFASNGNIGGHFLNDITPNDIEYEGYFNLASLFIRISPPQRTFELPY